MNTISMGHNEYKRLDFGALNFANDKEIDKETVEDVTPIHWSESVILGIKQIAIRT